MHVTDASHDMIMLCFMLQHGGRTTVSMNEHTHKQCSSVQNRHISHCIVTRCTERKIRRAKRAARSELSVSRGEWCVICG